LLSERPVTLKERPMHLGADESVEAGRLMPVRMLNEFTYCPRLFYLEWVQGEFVDNEFTVEGRVAHRRVMAPHRRARLRLRFAASRESRRCCTGMRSLERRGRKCSASALAATAYR
jgi:hypothetical protein